MLSGLVRSDAALNRLRELIQDFFFLDIPCGGSSTNLSLSTIRLAIPHCSSCPSQTLLGLLNAEVQRLAATSVVCAGYGMSVAELALDRIHALSVPPKRLHSQLHFFD